MLFQHGINFNDLPSWQKRGMGVYWEEYDKPGENPLTGEKVTARRRRLRRDLELPMGDAYSTLCGVPCQIMGGQTIPRSYASNNIRCSYASAPFTMASRAPSPAHPWAFQGAVCGHCCALDRGGRHRAVGPRA